MMSAVEAAAPPATGSYLLNDATLHVDIEAFTEETSRKAFHTTMRRLRRLGFSVGRDPKIERDHKILGPSHRAGRHGDLEFCAEYFPRGLRIEFFQNLVTENQHGGRYDFDRVAKMPYLVRKRFEWTLRHLRRLFAAMSLTEDPQRPSIYTDPLGNFNHGWDSAYEQSRGIHRFRRDESGWPDESELRCWSQKGADGIPLRFGDVKYTRVRGRLVRGRVHGGINGMWFLVYGVGRIEPVGEFANHNASAFFACDAPSQQPRRWFTDDERRRRRVAALARAVSKRDWMRAAVLQPIVDRDAEQGAGRPE